MRDTHDSIFTVYQPVPGPSGPPTAGPSTYNPIAGPSYYPIPGTSYSLQPGVVPHDNVAFEMDEDYHTSTGGGAPPSYDEVINSTRFPIVRTRRPCTDDRSWKVDFVDFTPHLPQNPGNKQLGNFRLLLQRLNTWLKANPDIEVIRCETVTWAGVTQTALNETNVVQQTRSLSSSVKTRYQRGIRLWFVPLLNQDGTSYTPISLEMLDFSPTDSEDNVQNLVKKLNKKIKTEPIPGKVLTIETVWAKSSSSKISTAATYWTEQLHKTRQYGFFLRIYFIQGELFPLEIGLKDFLPAQTSDSYENFGHVTEKAANWILEQTDITVTNLQAVYIKKKGPPNNCNNRCYWTEHPIKPDASITYFYQICRVAYIKSLQEVNVMVSMPLQLTKKTFAPALLPPVGEEQETRFENFTKTVERVSSWLDSTGAQVFCMETVPVRVQTAFQQRQGPEATLVWSLAEPGVKNEDWLIFVRVYIRGSLREPHVHHVLSLLPAVDWHRRQSRQPITPHSQNRKRTCIILSATLFIFIITAFIVVYIAFTVMKVYVKGELREQRVTHMLAMPPIDWYRRQNNPTVTRQPSRKRNYVICCLIVLIAVIGSFIIMYIAYSFIV